MQDICQIIIEYVYDVDTLKSLYLSSDIFRELLNSKNILLKLTDKFNIVNNSNKIECFKDFIDRHGTLMIPNKSKYKKYNGSGSYFTHNNGDRLFNVRINDGIVNVHTEGRIVTDSEEDEDYYPSNEEDNYSIEPFMNFELLNIFVGKDPFNNNGQIMDEVNYNPNINDDPNFGTFEYFENNFINLSNDELDHDDMESIFNEYIREFYYDIDRSGYDGSNILLHLKDYDYIFISYKLFAFTSIAKIVNFVSNEGNADVPYSYAIDEYNNVYLFTIDSTDIKNQEGVIIMMDKDHLKYLQGKSDSDYYHMNPYNYYFFVLTDKEKSDNTKYKPICSTIEYFNGMDKYKAFRR
jgi:hypothetical protein